MTKVDIQDFLDKILFLYPITPKKIAITVLFVVVVFFAGRVTATECQTTNCKPPSPTVIHETKHIHHRINPAPYIIGGAVVGISLSYAWNAKKDEKIKIGVEARKPE